MRVIQQTVPILNIFEENGKYGLELKREEYQIVCQNIYLYQNNEIVENVFISKFRIHY